MTIELPNGYEKVLDKGYVGLKDSLGDDWTPADAARVSFAKASNQYSNIQNESLIKYLARNKEFSTFRHNAMTFEMRMPLMVARQLWKYIVASNFTEDQLGWNENSRRYITDANEFYVPGPNEWRTAPENKKHGSGEPLSYSAGESWTESLMEWYDEGNQRYEDAIEKNIAPELARLFLPAYGLYVTCYWTASLNAIFHVLEERLEHDAQKEIQDYAKVIRDFVQIEFPVIYKCWKESLDAKN